MAEFAKRAEVTVSTMGKVHNPDGSGVPAISKKNKAPAPPPSPVANKKLIGEPPKNIYRRETDHETKVKEEGSSRRNITRKKNDGAAAGGNYDSRNKKQGGAGKGKWMEALDGSDSLPLDMDKDDPLYDDSIMDGAVLVSSDNTEGNAQATGYDHVVNKKVYGPMLTLPEFKIRVSEALQEYFDSGDDLEVIRCIRELKCAEYHPEVVKRAVSISLDKTSREKELISRLLSVLHPEPLTDENIADGFELLIESLDDLSIDAPDAKGIVGAFLARAVVDEVLPPAFLSNRTGVVIEGAVRLLSREHCGVRLEKVWGPGDGRPVSELKVVMDQLLKEYLLSRELDEAARCIREMNSSHFHHELVKRGVTAAMEEHESTTSLDAMAALFAFLVENAIVSETQIIKGLRRLHSIVDDLKLDIGPKVPEMLKEFEGMLEKMEVVPKDYAVVKDT
mmetsp:Transcript_22044/g.32203  ORF Transcript_22044/g.32203 Transcript_22044/m.32203 type:complete len:449 (+) Transcript_22044:141-1487(+)|eukprot:CAMPEP_0195519626 /NCGR_PEP_ID=MMETSP0794_2-20130614/15158_1 /TAXON_ID=515487 /ORGANISM="Stephanopyxis turris, Strain CCMP 815" /LENGTH=448 /DNA_ID=CAMNT_0040648811 /DNA_START=137 /DNA_END=1483 /DNA_ORIENTATION=-